MCVFVCCLLEPPWIHIPQTLTCTEEHCTVHLAGELQEAQKYIVDGLPRRCEYIAVDLSVTEQVS